jgi:AraC-like DNA-binding protein
MYHLRRPAPTLGAYIEHYWFVTVAPGESIQLRVDVYVDARPDLVFNFGAPYQRTIIGGETCTIHASNLDAQRLVPIRIEQRGAVRISGVRFHLGGLAPFATAPLNTVTGQTVAPDAVLGEGVVGLERQLAALDEIDAQAQALDRFFLDALATAPPLAAFSAVLAAASDSRGAATADAMARAAGVGVRQVERLFARHLGLPPKTLLRVLRFQRALRGLMREPTCSLTELAATSGYFDQAHFIKDFRTMTGGVPRGYRGYYPPAGPADFAPNVVAFLQDDPTAVRE